ncbi:FAS1-like dehydratase domain-containing protein [Kocuria sp.]|uniref:FAS1-like dehydratase domain-containing protein n=1 Tax=Kocuria sp. TaxID=1871328 RepID=UPI0026DFA395|nr:MaoC family dehydratase N-terminal domain-containing protein [Kocuria sp.]MDO5617436.1 MaoC family dehydratase N-terminal domain-containing protein [Kocuria sp.]
MSVNPDVAGRTYPSIAPYQVSREAIRAFAHTVGGQNPIHQDVEAARAAGHADLVAPPTFAIIVAQKAEAAVVADETAGIDFSRVVHADQRFTHHRAIVAGDELTAATTVDGVRAVGTGAMVSFRTDILDGDGHAVSTAVSSLLVRGEDQ